MSGILNQEAKAIQNAAFCSRLIWEFLDGYISTNKVKAAPFQLVFIVLPIVLCQETYAYLDNTHKNLYKYIEKVHDDWKRDILLSLQERIYIYYELTSRSIAIGIASDIVTLNKSEMLISSCGINKRIFTLPSDNMKKIAKNCNKLGRWCSSHSMKEVSTILKVAL